MRKKLVNHFPFPFNSDKNSCFLYNELIGWINCCYKSREAIHFHLMSISQQFVEFSSWETLPCCRAPDPVWLATVFVSPWLETCCATDVVFWEDLLPCVSVTVGEKIHKAGKEVGLCYGTAQIHVLIKEQLNLNKDKPLRPGFIYDISLVTVSGTLPGRLKRVLRM